MTDKVIAYRLVEDAQESFLCIMGDMWDDQTERPPLILKESSKCVDGIGGTTWDGALHMCRLFAALPPHLRTRDLHILELGCGSGLFGLFARTLSPERWRVTLTDREVDLALTNARLLEKQYSMLSSGLVASSLPLQTVLPLTWGCLNGAEQENGILSACPQRPDVIVGCEVACLRRQQEALIASILHVMNPETLVFISFDEPPQPNSCSSERDFDTRTAAVGFKKATVQASSLRWLDSCQPPRADDRIAADGQYEYRRCIHDLWERAITLTLATKASADHASDGAVALTSLSPTSDRSGLLASRGFFSDLSSEFIPVPVSAPARLESAAVGGDNATGDDTNICVRCRATSSPSGRDSAFTVAPACATTAASQSTVDPPTNFDSLAVQHICVYYRPEAVATCCLCKNPYFRVLG